MAGPLSAPEGRRTDPGKSPHEKCQDRANCTGPGCRVRTGKTYHKRTGAPSKRTTDQLHKVPGIAEQPENQETAA